MATEPMVSKLRVESGGNGNGNGNGVARDEEPVEPASSVAALPVIDPEQSTLARSDQGSGRWVIAGDGQLLGVFSGEIECGGTLMVGKGAEVTATIRGNDITIAGLVRGNITAVGRLKIAPSGRLEGDARVGSLVVQEGGVHHGVIRVHPEGIPEVDEVGADSTVSAGSGSTGSTVATPADRVRKFWGEFF